MQAKKGLPPHIRSRSTCWSGRQILVHRSRRDLNSQLQQQLIGNAFLAPRWILIRHPADQGLNFNWNRWDGRVATSSATTVSIPRGANGSLFPGAPPPERPASERIVKGTPARLVLPNPSAAAQHRARRTARAVGAETDSPLRSIVVIAAPSSSMPLGASVDALEEGRGKDGGTWMFSYPPWISVSRVMPMLLQFSVARGCSASR